MTVSDLTRICSTVSFICVAVLITIAAIVLVPKILQYKLEKLKIEKQEIDDGNGKENRVG